MDGGVLKQVTNGESGKNGDGEAPWSLDGTSLVFGYVDPGSFPTNDGVPASASIHVVDLRTGHVSALPGSDGMFSPRWSPNGRLIAGLSAADRRILLYDFQIQKQSDLSSVKSAYPNWSQDGESLFYATTGEDASWWRVRLRDRKTERVAVLKNMDIEGWFAQAPDNSLIAARMVGTQEIYALDWEAP